MEAFAPLRYLIRPLQLEAVLLIVTFSILLMLASHAGLFGLPLAFIVISWFLKYAFILLDHIADGKPGAPVLSAEMANPLGEARPWMYLSMMVIFLMATEFLRPTLGSTALSSVRMLGVCALPAIIAVHTVTGSVIEAMNPVAMGAMAWRMRWGYLCVLVVPLVSFTAMLFIAVPPPAADESAVRMLTLQFMPSIVRTMVLMYLWLSMFAVLGGALFEYRDAIGFEASHSPERIQAREDAECDFFRNRFIDRVFGEYRSGAYINAWNSIQEQVRNGDDALVEYRWLFARIAQWPSPRLANRLAQEMLPLLLAKQLHSEALSIAKNRMNADAEFRPSTGEQLLKLAQLARDAGDRPLARALLKDFDRHFPNHPVRTSVAQLVEQLAR
jgi:hypothetical protein